MASGKFRDFAEDIQLHFLLGTSQSAPSAANVRIALVTTAPSSTATGTELSASGYTAGGIACGFGTPVQGDPTETDNDAQIQWTAGGSPWTTIVGVVVHRGGGTLAAGTSMYFVDSLSLSVPASGTLTIAAGNLSTTEA